MVSIIACTMRDMMMENVLENYSRQIYKDKELIIILNEDKMDIEKWRKKALNFDNVTVFQLPEELTLGDCMNFGIEKANFNVISKFDDDDYYSPYYLTEAMKAFEENPEVQLIGKGVCFLYFEENNLLTVYKKGKESEIEDGFLKGGTLVFKKELYPEIKFPSQKTGSDSGFRIECNRRNVKSGTTSRYNYVCTRRADLKSHTYQLPASEFMKLCEVVGTVNEFSNIVIKQF
jgi:glycosyltransferase involved in cell wall biosynthesis